MDLKHKCKWRNNKLQIWEQNIFLKKNYTYYFKWKLIDNKDKQIVTNQNFERNESQIQDIYQISYGETLMNNQHVLKQLIIKT